MFQVAQSFPQAMQLRELNMQEIEETIEMVNSGL
jgi:hypothetical protein